MHYRHEKLSCSFLAVLLSAYGFFQTQILQNHTQQVRTFSPVCSVCPKILHVNIHDHLNAPCIVKVLLQYTFFTLYFHTLTETSLRCKSLSTRSHVICRKLYLHLIYHEINLRDPCLTVDSQIALIVPGGHLVFVGTTVDFGSLDGRTYKQTVFLFPSTSSPVPVRPRNKRSHVKCWCVPCNRMCCSISADEATICWQTSESDYIEWSDFFTCVFVKSVCAAFLCVSSEIWATGKGWLRSKKGRRRYGSAGDQIWRLGVLHHACGNRTLAVLPDTRCQIIPPGTPKEKSK